MAEALRTDAPPAETQDLSGDHIFGTGREGDGIGDWSDDEPVDDVADDEAKVQAEGEDEPVEELEAQAEVEPEVKEQSAAPTPESAPAWLAPMLDAQAQRFQDLVERLAPKPEEPAAEPSKPLDVGAVLSAGLASFGLDPESDEGRQLLDAAALDRTRSFFPDEHHGQIDERVAKGNRTARRLTASQAKDKKLDETIARLDAYETREKRGPLIADHTRLLTTRDTYKDMYPEATKLPPDVLAKYLDGAIEGAADPEATLEAARKLDDRLQGLSGKTAEQLRSMADVAEWMGDPNGHVLAAYASLLEGSTDEQPADPPKKRSKRPDAPRGNTGSRIAGRPGVASHQDSYLFGGGEAALEAEADDLHRKATLAPKRRPN